jgi:hypothetical protein
MSFVKFLIIHTPFPTFPKGEARALRNNPVGYFSEGASLPRGLFPLGRNGKGGLFEIKSAK